MLKTISLISAIMLGVVGAALAQTATPGLPLVPLGYCQLSSLGSAVKLATCNSNAGIPAGANEAYICAESEIVRYRDDGTAPTSSVGQPIVSGGCMFYTGTLSALQFIQAQSSATLDVSFYRSP